MRSPLESESVAFRYVLWTIAFFVPVVLASWIAGWLGLAVFLFETVAVIVLAVSTRRVASDADDAGVAAVDDTDPARIARAGGGPRPDE